jgi:hypothetical protein
VIYEGIDFANQQRNVGYCYVVDDGRTLRVLLEHPEKGEIRRRAVDCPLGVGAGFSRLLVGDLTNDHGNDGYKTRYTERWLRAQVPGYQTNQRWLGRNADERREFPRASYFNGGSHVQPAAGLQIVPACLDWLLRELALDLPPEDRLAAAAAARRGEATVIEAHPRMFLYSAIERLYHHNNELISISTLNDVADYKDKGKTSHEDRRGRVYRFLQRNFGWTGQNPRTLEPAEPPDVLLATDHKFDAWLCALTAWAHENHETVMWLAAGIPHDVVHIEGHILILK